MALAALLIGAVVLFRYGSVGPAMLWSWSREGQWLFPLVAVTALIDSINPCAFSVLLLTVAFLFSIGKLQSKVLSVGLFYIAGIFVVYLMIGLGILQTLHLFNTPHFMAKVGAGALIALGLINLAGVMFPKFPIKLKIPDAAHRWMAELMEKGSMPAAFALGALVGICEFPCTGGPYLMVLGLLHDRSTFVPGFGYLLFYNAIFIAPLVIMLLIASEKTLVEKVRAWQQKESGAMRYAGGLVMVALGALIYFL